MIRLFTRPTLNASGEPTAWTNYFDIEFCDMDVNMSDNINMVEERTGLIRHIHDPKSLYPVQGSLMINTTHLNLKGAGATLRYLANELYRTYSLHLPICIFLQNNMDMGMKSYVGYLTSCNKFVAANCTIDATVPMNTTRLSMPRTVSFDVLLTLDGIYDNIDDITSPVWNIR